jgi:hypothetical protein
MREGTRDHTLKLNRRTSRPRRGRVVVEYRYWLIVVV